MRVFKLMKNITSTINYYNNRRIYNMNEIKLSVEMITISFNRLNINSFPEQNFTRSDYSKDCERHKAHSLVRDWPKELFNNLSH